MQKPGSRYLNLPPVGGEYMLELLFKVGPGIRGATGPTELSWSELRAWQELTGMHLDGWEAELIIELSRAYIGGIRQYNDKTARAPDASGAEFDKELKKHMGRMMVVKNG